MRIENILFLSLLALLSLALTSLNPLTLAPIALFLLSLPLSGRPSGSLLSCAAFALLVGTTLPLSGEALPQLSPLPALLLALLALPLLSSSMRRGPDVPPPLKLRSYLYTGLLLTIVIVLHYTLINFTLLGLIAGSETLTEVFLLSSLTLLTAGLLLETPGDRRD
ncbi:MAG: hypothetical protein DRN40_05320 [Thermoplasmata archaeon]|nr:MAG: hypothetical protein DRN40_05320 [Thermoplasmata archaeon]